MNIENIENAVYEVIRRRRLAVAATASVFIMQSSSAINKKRRKHRWWVHPINQKRVLQGDWDNLIREMRLCDEVIFFNYTRLNVNQFDKLLSIVEHRIKKIDLFRPSIPPGARLAITLRHLSTGDSLPTLAYGFRIGKSTACKIIKETCDALWDELSATYLKYPTVEQWKQIAMEFEENWNLPHCLGAIDGKHVVIQAPKNSGSQYYNYKKSFSIVLLAICDANYNFVYVNIGAYGSQSDGGIFRETGFGHDLLHGNLNLPSNEIITNTNISAPFFFVGDEAFPLNNHLLRPYGGANLTPDKRIFNYRLSRARRCIENAFGILVSRFRIYHRVINAYPETVDSIIKATVVLHNYIKSDGKDQRYCPNNYVDTYDSAGNVISGDWRENMPKHSALDNIRNLKRRLGARNATRTAEHHRTTMKDYVNSSVGEVSWQHTII